MADAPLLEVRDLRVSFATPRGAVRAVDGASFTVGDGETVAIVGESGSGKSVTALSALRLFSPDDRVSLGGEMLWRGRDGGVRNLLALDQRAIRDIRGGEIAIVFQDPSASLDPVFTIGEQIAEAIRRHRPGERSRASGRAAELLDDVGIPDAERRLGAYPHQLSGGMRQRVMIAIALACAPRLLIADEPTTALDVTIQAQILALLAGLKQRHGMGLLFITHDLALVGQIADRVVVMYAGEVVETGPTAQVLAAPGHPYTRALLDCRPVRIYRDDGADERVLNPIPGAPPRPTDLGAGCRFAPRCARVGEICLPSRIPLEPLGEGRMARCLRMTVPA